MNIFVDYLALVLKLTICEIKDIQSKYVNSLILIRSIKLLSIKKKQCY